MEPDIIIESHIPFANGVLEPYAHVRYLRPEQITPQAMSTAHALVTRTRTRVDKTLLEHSPCTIVASATIGLDHVDSDWCRAHGVEVKNAPGCNAPAVAQYVLASLLHAFGKKLTGHTLGVVGVGHVGSIVARWARALGMEVLQCDPPRARIEGSDGFFNIDELTLRADAITIHTPYTRFGPDATHGLFDADRLLSLRRGTLLINSARGPIVNTHALLKAIDAGTVQRAVIDCWDPEPDIDLTLLRRAYIATPHIAGYSLQGKQRATYMALSQVARHFGFPDIPVPDIAMDAPVSVTAQSILSSYNPMIDTEQLRSTPDHFEQLRNQYPLRNEAI